MILFLGGILDTCDYFLECMREGREDVLFLDVKEEGLAARLMEIDAKITPGMLVFTFNNIGITITSGGKNYWEEKKVNLVNMYVDPPQWYKDALNMHLSCMTILTVDRKHLDFIHKYYPQQKCYFMPHGGYAVSGEKLPFAKRRNDVVYFGNKKRRLPIDDETMELLENAIMENPNLEGDEVLLGIFEGMGVPLPPSQEVDLLYSFYQTTRYNVQSRYQNKILKKLAKAGISLTIYGEGWEELKSAFPDNVKLAGRITPPECLEIMKDTKIVLNMMPWFKDGSHERVFHAMRNGAICLSDPSGYLRERFQDGETILYYDLKDLDTVVSKIQEILQDEERAQAIVKAAFDASAQDTWKHRLCEIEAIFA